MGGIAELGVSEFHRVKPLFDGFDFDRALIGGVFEQHQKGRIFCDDIQAPTCAVMFHPGDYAYLAGHPTGVNIQQLVALVPRDSGVSVGEYEIFCLRNTTWVAELCVAFGDRLKRGGYEYFTFTNAQLDWILKWPERVPKGMRVMQMDAELARRGEDMFHVVAAQTWGSVERFLESGFGFVVVSENGDLVGAISTFGIGEGMAEIDIATHKDYRRRGLATLMGCAFVDHCLSHKLTPSWTANYGNYGSMATARKLGFVDRFILPCFTLSK